MIYFIGQGVLKDEVEESPVNEGDSSIVVSVNEELYGNGNVKTVNRLAPDFTLKGLDGKSHSLKDFRGKKVLVNFWTTWCPPCQREMPILEKYYETHDVVVVGVNITDQEFGADVIQEFKDYYQLSFPILLDEKGEVSKAYEVLTIPTSFVVDEEGRIVKEIVGPVTEEILEDNFE